MAQTSTVIPEALLKHEASLLSDWVAKQGKTGPELHKAAREFLGAFREGAQSGSLDSIDGAAWEHAREVLTDFSIEQSRQGVSAVEVATFILSLKEPLFALLQRLYSQQPEIVAREVWNATRAIDQFALHTTSVALKTREELIARQQSEMLELSTPVVKLWDGVLALPLIGTLDSERTQVVMENLLEEIVRSGAGVAIIDITGVPTVDTLVAQHLLKTVAAARLMGAECIISGIRPQIAATIVHLGVDLGDVTTKATLADAFRIALYRNGLQVTARAARNGGAPEPARG